MNLQAIAAGATRSVTPSVSATLYLSRGSVPQPNSKRTPLFDIVEGVTADIQAVTGKDLKQLDALNIQNVERVAYLAGNVEGVNRVRGKGGDFLVIASPAADAGTWLVTAVLETWGTAGWCKVGLTLQTNPAIPS